jgi:hypothetical protein
MCPCAGPVPAAGAHLPPGRDRNAMRSQRDTAGQLGGGERHGGEGWHLDDGRGICVCMQWGVEAEHALVLAHPSPSHHLPRPYKLNMPAGLLVPTSQSAEIESALTFAASATATLSRAAAFSLRGGGAVLKGWACGGRAFGGGGVGGWRGRLEGDQEACRWGLRKSGRCTTWGAGNWGAGRGIRQRVQVGRSPGNGMCACVCSCANAKGGAHAPRRSART